MGVRRTRATGRVRWRAATLMIAAALVPGAGAAQGAHSTAGGEARIRYELDATFDPEAGALTGRVVLHIPASRLESPLRLNVATSSTRMDVLAVRELSSGAALTVHEPAGESFVTVEVPARGLSGGLAVEYSMPVTAAPGPFGYNLLSTNLGRPWYPEVLASDGRFVDFRDYEVSLRYPEGYGLLSTGGPGRGTVRDGLVHATFAVEGEEDFALALGRGFVVEEDRAGTVPVHSFFHPDYRERFDEVRARTVEAVRWYEDTYGFFPRSSVGIVQGHPVWGGGFPMAGVFMVHLGILRDDFLAFITAHELGHYYWGLHVLGDQERLDWLVLANGIWIDQLYLAERSGRTLAEQWRWNGNGEWIVDYLQAMLENREQRLGITGPNTEPGYDYNSRVRHGKGATGLFLQSMLLGPERFLELQKTLLRDFAMKPLSVEDFVQALTAAGLDGAEAFFREWIRSNALVGAGVARVAAEEDGSHSVVVARNGSVPYPIPLSIVLADGATHEATLAADAPADTFQVAGRPDQILFDPDGVIPMWNASHPRMRALFIEAALLERLDGLGVPLAEAHLEAHPDDERIRSLLVGRLEAAGRTEEADRYREAGSG